MNHRKDMKKISWTYEKRKIDALTENKNNPRQLSKQKAEELKKSLEKFGVCQPIVMQSNGEIIGGHQRIKTLKSIGVSEVDVAIPSRELSRKEYEELTIRLNKNVGEWDFDLLANTWDPNDLIEWGFTEQELHLDLESDQKPISLSINIKFDNKDDLRKVEKELTTIICDFPSASMKVKVK